MATSSWRRCAIGLCSFLVVGGLGVVGFAGQPLRLGVPAHIASSLVVLAVVAVCSGAAWRGPRRGAFLALAGGAGGSLIAAWFVAAYDNGWTLGGWPDFARSTELIATLAFVPLSACGVAAARSLADRGLDRRNRLAALVVLAVCLGWLGYVTVPYVFSWGPVLLVLISCCVVLALSGRRGTDSAPAA